MNWLSELVQKRISIKKSQKNNWTPIFSFPGISSDFLDDRKSLTAVYLLKGSTWKINCDDLLKLVIIDTHQWHFSATALVEFVATGLAAEALEQQLPAEVAER